MASRICARETESAALSAPMEPSTVSSVSSRSNSPSSPSDSKSDMFCITALRTFWRRNQSIVAFGHDALEQQGQLRRRAVGVLLRQPDHGVLNDVQRRVIVAHGVHRALEGALLDVLEEIREFFVGRQGGGGLCAGALAGQEAARIIASRPCTAAALRNIARTDAIMLLRTKRVLVSPRQPDRGTDVVDRAVPHPPHEGASRGTKGFSSEKFTEV